MVIFRSYVNVYLRVPQKMMASWHARTTRHVCFTDSDGPSGAASQRVPQRPMMTAFCLPDSTAVVTFTDTPIAGGFKIEVPSGKQPHSNGKSLFLLGKSTISMTIFNSKLLAYQMVPPF